MQNPTSPPTASARRANEPDVGATHAESRQIAADALRFWERQRITYNAVLLLVVAGVFLAHWPQFVRQASVDFFLALFLLAVLANVAFCAAYPADLFVQRSGLRPALGRVRWALLAVGIVFAGVLAQFIARGMVAGA
ncbi:MAG: hypothetical protein M3Q42_04930 [Pseudomonadota bacterium]|nr:hypothetical protein [Pseudomonadota bacterium]